VTKSKQMGGTPLLSGAVMTSYCKPVR
jgi:hypothetical protein